MLSLINQNYHHQMNNTQPSIIFSKRKTLSIQINKFGSVIVRAPLKTDLAYIQSFLKQKEQWIQAKVEYILNLRAQLPTHSYSEIEKKKMKIRAKSFILDRLNHWSVIMNIRYQNFRLSSAKTRWGSCSNKNTISINWKLILAPLEVLDYVVIHELAHVKEKNHAKAFWNLVQTFDPNYKHHRQWLRAQNHLIEI
jgi:predicted metal-dependent hydrolase